MATTDIRVTLATDGAWTAVTPAGPVNVQLVTLPLGWELRIATSLPDPTDLGTFVTAADGAWASSGLDAADIIYARPLVNLAGIRPALVVSGFWN